MPGGGVGRKRRAARMALGMRHAARTAAWRCAQGQTVDWGATVHQGLRLVKEPEMEWARSVLTTAWMPLPADAMVPTCCHMLHHMLHAACPHLPHAIHDRLWRSPLATSQARCQVQGVCLQFLSLFGSPNP